MRCNFESKLKRLDHSQIDRVFKIIIAESSIQAINFQKDKIKIKSRKDYYDRDIWKHQIDLTNLTGNLEGEELIKEMVRFSE